MNPPTARGSTLLFPTYEAFREKKSWPIPYGRFGTDTHRALEESLCAHEGAEQIILFPSGLMAITATVLALADSGDHVLITDSAYDPVRGAARHLMARMGIEAEFYDPRIGADIEKKLRPNTALVLCESPGSLTFEVQDIPAISTAARARGVPVMVDNTWAAGHFCNPLGLGADISMQAATKYIGGHSDALLGYLALNDAALAKKIQVTATNLGVQVGADDAALIHRGLRTLPTRLAAHEGSGLDFARWLEAQPAVKKILHPALDSHPDHALWQRDYTGTSSLFGVLFHSAPEEKIAAFFNHLTLFGLGYSWGGYESLCIPVQPENYRSATPWCEDGQLLRLHIGLEDIDDLKEDFAAALRYLSDD